MRLLLDTHIAIWSVHDTKRLSAGERGLIAAADTAAVSVMTVWEIAIKFVLPKGRADDMPFSGSEALGLFEAAGLRVLPVTSAHAAAVDYLPSLHGDPFDRMLIAQATIEGMRLMTRDTRLKGYGAMVLAG